MKVHDTDDDTTDNYPPWVTKIPDKEDDISVDGNCIDGSNCNGDDKSVDPDAYSKRTSSGTSLSPGLSSTFRGRAMVYYMLPTFMIWLGRNVIGTRAQATYSTSSSHGMSWKNSNFQLLLTKSGDINPKTRCNMDLYRDGELYHLSSEINSVISEACWVQTIFMSLKWSDILLLILKTNNLVLSL